MTLDQIITLVVLIGVVGAMIWDKIRADVVALAGAAVLLMTGVVRPVEVQSAFASPAIIALASLFVISYALELSGLLDRAIAAGVKLCKRMGAIGIWILLGAISSTSAFLNNTPIVVLAAPVIRDVSTAMKLSPKRYLMPLSYVTVLFGCTTLIGTSTNLLVNDMAGLAGQARFGIFEITPVGLTVALAGGLYLFLFSGRMLRNIAEQDAPAEPAEVAVSSAADFGSGQLGDPEVFAEKQPFAPGKAALSFAVFAAAIALATMNVAPIAATAFAGAVLLILLRVITADQAYHGLRPEILILIAGMVVLGIAMEESGLAAATTQRFVGSLKGLSPLVALIALYAVTLVLTELLSNATVAVLITPVAIALAESLGVSPRPFLVAVMMAASLAFATPFGYQTNVIVYQMGGYSYLDFVKVGLPLNLLTFAVAIATIPVFFPF
ncbi:MAG: SLC13/DASS family transporter [Sphingomonadales bacterium]|nr:SLC13/DASS family transporter [Sphingomonadales bacterium]